MESLIITTQTTVLGWFLMTAGFFTFVGAGIGHLAALRTQERKQKILNDRLTNLK